MHVLAQVETFAWVDFGMFLALACERAGWALWKKTGVPGPPLGAYHPGWSARPSIRLAGAHGSILATCPSD
eukprot:scaffold96026_cov38-Phaeocystis_antarctica.AAC.1